MTTIDAKSSFVEQLYKAYPDRVRNSPGGPLQVRIDDQASDDNSYGFCTIQVLVPDPTIGNFILTVSNVPFDGEVETTVKNLGGVWTESRQGKSFSIPLTIKGAGKVRILARRIRGVIAPGKQYLYNNWKWMVPRTVESMQYFASVLSGLGRESRQQAE